MTGDPLDSITACLERFFDESDAAALDEACRQAAGGAFDMARLLAWLDHAPADEEPKDRATRRLRAAMGLPPMAGAACRPVTFGPDGKVRRR